MKRSTVRVLLACTSLLLFLLLIASVLWRSESREALPSTPWRDTPEYLDHTTP